MGANTFRVHEKDLIEHFKKSMGDLFQYAKTRREFKIERENVAKYYDAAIYEKILYDQGVPLIKNFPDDNAHCLNIYINAICERIQMNVTRLKEFIGLYSEIKKFEQHNETSKIYDSYSYEEIRRMCPSKEEFIRIALYTEKMPQYESLFRLFDHETESLKVMEAGEKYVLA